MVFWFVEPSISTEHILSIFRVEAKQETEDAGGKLSSASVGFWLSLLFDPKDGGHMIFRNFGLSSRYMASNTD
jgi:hypothetical protein